MKPAMIRVHATGLRRAWPTVSSACFPFLASSLLVGAQPNSTAGDPVTLSPFVISAGANDGYNPTETLSGTRLRTSVRDTASALTILTPQLLDDLGIVDVEGALSFVANTEPHTLTEQDTAGFSNRNTVKPFVSRGLTTTSYNANFFETNAPLDRYSLEEITFTRGPNSILFGTGFAGGALNAQPKRAHFRNSLTFDTRFDDFGSSRGVFDLNRELVSKKVAVRIAGVRDHRETHREPASEERSSIYGTASWQIAPQTSLRISGEVGEISKVVPWILMFTDAYTPWVRAGRRTVATPRAANGSMPGTQWIFNNDYHVKIENPSAANLPVMNWRMMAQGALPNIGGVNRADVPILNEADAPIPLGTAIEGPGNKRDYWFDSVEATFEHRLFENFFVEIAGKHMNSDYDDLTTIRANSLFIFVDPNERLPNGDPNPFVGLPYVENGQFALGQNGDTRQNQARASAAYSLNLDDRKVYRDLGLGRYQFGAFFTDSRTTAFTRWTRETANASSFNGAPNARQNFFHRRYYLEPNGQPFLSSDFANIVQAGSATNIGISNVNTAFLETHLGALTEKLRLQGLSLIWQGFFLKDRLVYTGGWREDRSKNTRGQMPLGPDRIFLPWNAAAAGWTTTEYRGRTRTDGLTLHVLPQLSLFASRSENFVPPGLSRTDFHGNALPPTVGDGIEAGIRFNLLADKITGSLSYYTTEEQNRQNAVVAQRKRTWIDMMWDAIRPGTYDEPSSAWLDTEDRRSKGYELQLAANPIPALRLYGSLAKARVRKSNLYPIFRAYWEANRATFEANRARPVVDLTNSGHTTVGQTYDALTSQFANDLADEGGPVRNTREWSSSGAATYSFPQERLKGLRATVRGIWREAPVIGFLLNAQNRPDSARTIRGRDELTWELALAYERRVRLGRFATQMRLGVQVLNVFDDAGYIPLEAVAYSPSAYYINKAMPAVPRTFAVTTSFGF